MNQFGPFAVLIGVAAVLLAAFGGMVAWWNEEGRLIRRGLRAVLKEEPHALVVAPGRGRGAGFNFTSNTMAVTWDCGAWCLIYHIHELLGVELIVDGQVAARTYRGEPRRPLDVLGGAERQVTLRLVFDDPRHADFTLELWSAADAGRRRGLSAADAVEEGNRWIARTESVFRRKPAGMPGRPAPRSEPEVEAEPPPAAAPAAAAAAAGAPTPRQELPFEDEAPWDDEDEDKAVL
ncbi:MAG: hypothetical protein JWQ97_594 [Phenylobacterium sp.]|nr:hypothetical protein [Phenylobacterium sp.]